MKIKSFALIAALPMVAMATPVMAQNAGEPIANSYICVFNQAVSRGNARAEANRAAQAADAQLKHVYSVAIRGFAVNAAPQAIANMQRNNSNIAYCEQDQVVTVVPTERAGARAPGGNRGGGGGSTQPAQETPWGVARVNGGAAGNFATAWVIDSGIQLDHPDLNVDLQRSASFVRGDAGDQNGHGTHVAGTIAAIDNNFGVIGVAPGATVVSVRVLDRRGSGAYSGVIAGVDHVAQYGRPGDVANMSLGGGTSAALDQAVLNAAAGGVRFTLAAGNESTNANNSSPARVNGPNVFTVSSFAIGDNWSSFSNYGNPPVDFAEPGSSIKSTWTGGGYNTISGTSMAAPHLAGILLQGAVGNGGRVNGDPDGNPDTIGVVN